MNQKVDKKRYIRPKSDTQTLEISEPYAFRHDLHIGQEVYDERQVDNTFVFSQTPCPETSSDVLLTNSSFSKVIENEVIPAIRSEIADIVEEKLRHILNEQKKTHDNRHCSTCLCVENKVIYEENGLIRKEKSDHANLLKETNSDEVHEDSDYTKRKVAATAESIEGEQKGLKSFRNPTHYKDAHTSLRHGGNLVKYGSDIHLAKPRHIEREKSSSFMRTQTLPTTTNRITSNNHSEMHCQKGKLLSKSDERKCLAHALQWHVEELIDGIVFKDSELPDDLLGDSCLTDEECSGLRKTLDHKNQVRILISIIKGRDLNVLERFLKHIKAQNESIAKSIEEKFEQNKSNGVRCTECALCNLTSNVNLKYIADRLWKYDLIDGGLFNWIVQSERPTGVQGELWRGVIGSLNVHCRKHRSDVSNILSTALTKNNHYDHVAKGLERMISTHGELFCHCELRPNIIQSAGSFLSLRSSRYPGSSEFDTDSKSEIVTSQFDNTSVKRVACQDMTVIKSEQDLIEPNTQTDDMKRKISQNQMKTEKDAPHTVETGEESPRVTSLSDFEQASDGTCATTSSPDDINAFYISKNNFESKEHAKSKIKQLDENTKESIMKSKLIPEENDDSVVQRKSFDTSSTHKQEETNFPSIKDENSKPAVPETHLKVFKACGRHIIVIPNDELVSSDV